MKKYKFTAEILASEKKGGAYIIFPYDIRKEFGKGRVKVNVRFEDIDYQGSIVNMGIKDEDGNICYIIGVLKSIRKTLGKDIGDMISVIVSEVNKQTLSDDNNVSKNINKENLNEKNVKEHKIFDTAFSLVYPLYVEKIMKKGRTKKELDAAIYWLSGYNEESLAKTIEDNITFREFFNNAPKINEKAILITGSICGVKIQEIENPLMKNIRYLDKLVDEIAKGKSMDKVLRENRFR